MFSAVLRIIHYFVESLPRLDEKREHHFHPDHNGVRKRIVAAKAREKTKLAESALRLQNIFYTRNGRVKQGNACNGGKKLEKFH